MRKEFVIRGKTVSGDTEVLNFGKYKAGTAYRMTEFSLYPSTSISANNDALYGTVTAGKTGVSPIDPDFDNEGLIASTCFITSSGWGGNQPFNGTIINDTFMITQNLILMVQNASGGEPINWQCKFESVKMTGPEEAAVNYKQFAISDV